MPAYSNPEDSPTGARRDHGGRRTYQEVVDERRAAVARAEAAERRADQAEASRERAVTRATDLEAELRHATENYQNGLETAMTQFETAITEAEAKVPTGALKFGCAHPYSPFPPSYSGQLVTDGEYWYCTFNHLRVGVLTRAGQS